MLKLNKKQKEILKNLVKGKGHFKTLTTPKEKDENIIEDIVKLYLKGLVSFQREYDIDWVGPSNEHQVRYKWYAITLDKKKTLKDIKQVLKAGACA